MSWPGNKWGQKTFDPDRFPDPDKMTQDLHDLHARLMISVWPKFDNDGPDQLEMRARNLLLGDGVTYDAFNPQARALYWKQANEGLFRHGIDAWWCDCTEPFEPDWHGPVKPEAWQRMVTNTSVFKKYLDPTRINAYSLVHSQGMYEGQRAATEEKRVVNLTRSGYPGQARYGTITWSGDVTARWETLKKQIPAGLNFTITGSPRWTFDIGGFFVDQHSDQWFWDGAFRDGCDDRGYRELFVRWFQVGAFLPMFRAHGTDTPREVWRFGKPGEVLYDTLVKFIRLRYRLLPYIYSLAGWETQRGYTMLRIPGLRFPRRPAGLQHRRPVYAWAGAHGLPGDRADALRASMPKRWKACPRNAPSTSRRGAAGTTSGLASATAAGKSCAPPRRSTSCRFSCAPVRFFPWGQISSTPLKNPARPSSCAYTRAGMVASTCMMTRATATATNRASSPGPPWSGRIPRVRCG